MGQATKPTPTGQITGMIHAVERTFGRTPRTPRDFDQLRQSVYERTSVLLSATTLKRLWGYLDEKVSPRRYTLDALCRYAGWADFDAMTSGSPDGESGPLALARLDMTDGSLRPGARVTIAWLPDREMEVEYLGEARFRIVSVLNTRLEAGDTFTAGIIAADQPLYLDRLTREGVDLGVYVCGRRSGIRFTLNTEMD